MIDAVVFFVFVIIISLFIFKSIMYRVKINKLVKELLSANINNNILKEKLEASLEANSVNGTNDTEAFTKFLSQSRDWAFEYIEDVQNKIKSMVNELDPEVRYFDKYGILSDNYPNYELAKGLVEHYHKLKSLLPEEQND